MHLTIPDKIRWVKTIPNDPLDAYSKKKRKRLRQLSERYTDKITTEIIPVTSELLDWFTPLYQNTISTKDNPRLFDIAAKTINNGTGKTYLALLIYENNVRIGATIFAQLENQINVAFRIFPPSWDSFQSDASPTLYSDWKLCQFAKERNIELMSHGKDRNPYGPNAEIGLAAFKLSVGCIALLPKEYDTCKLNTSTLTNDTLVCHLPASGDHITNATLVCKEDDIAKYQQLLKYDSQLSIEVEFRD